MYFSTIDFQLLEERSDTLMEIRTMAFLHIPWIWLQELIILVQTKNQRND